MAGPPYPVPNQNAPGGQVGVDQASGAIGASNLASYTVNTVGTNTIATNRSSPGGVFLGVSVPTGTPVVSAFDLIVTGTTTVTNALLALTTATLGQVLSPGPAGVGVRFQGTLLVVTTGTASSLTLWD